MLTTRQATIQDCKQLLQITQKAFAANPTFDSDFKDEFLHPESAEQFFHSDLTNPTGCFLVAENDNQLVGYINGGEKKIPYRRSKYFEIDTMAVDPQIQGQGVGSALIKALVDVVKPRGFTKLYVNSYVRNQSALNFYQKNGFDIIETCLEKTI